MIDWSRVDTVLLDMDGTLLDLHFDNHFWLVHLPRSLARHRDVAIHEAERDLFGRMRAVEGTLRWYCLDYWTRELGLEVVALKREISHLIRYRPGAEAFLAALAGAGKRRILVTNAHPDVLELKLERTGLAGHLEAVVSSHRLGRAKEEPAFWTALRNGVRFDPARALLLDDSPAVLRSARAWGLGQMMAIARPDSTRPAREPAGFPILGRFDTVAPLVGAS